MERSGKRLSPTVAKGLIPVDQAVSSAHHAIDRLSEVARPVVVRSAANVHHMVDRISGTASRAAERLGQTVTRLKDTEERLIGASRGYVRKHPFKSAGIAVGIAAGIALAVGFLVSQLASSRKSTEPGDSDKKSEVSEGDGSETDWQGK